MQYEISPTDLSILLALIRARTLADAGALLGMNASTVFRAVQRLERTAGERLFERTRAGYRPTDLATQLSLQAEIIETALAQAQSAFASSDHQLTGTVRVSAVDAVLQAFVVPALVAVRAEHPRLNIELLASNEPFSLTHREVDIALRSTNRPPQHVIGKRLGSIRFGVFGGRALARNFERDSSSSAEGLADLPWITVDDAMPEHPGVTWRKRVLPNVKPALQANTMQMVARMIEQGLGVGILALFHARENKDLVPLKLPLEDCNIDLWLLTHPESRHLRRIAEVAARIEAHVLRDGGLP
ncbi:LysR family transcriptional regulator [Paraburkholderia dinghuensis]|uniref:LysR family transcriptional regulator n=1 Tax=Paraburkholderia dinghuensis TaxID=2305225 RepID=UPI001FE6DEC9|nr:LysR family transcriptional regulator [Paraburkholderia dinghuensis]